MRKYLVLVSIIVLISGLFFISCISYSAERGFYFTYPVFSEALTDYTFLRNSIFEHQFTLTVKSDPKSVAEIQVYSGRWGGGVEGEILLLPSFKRRIPTGLFSRDYPAYNSVLVAEKNLNASGSAIFRLPRGHYYVVALIPFVDAYVTCKYKYKLCPPWLNPANVYLDKDMEVNAYFPITDYPPY